MVRQQRILAGICADARMERRHVTVTFDADRIRELGEWNDSTRPAAGDIDARDKLLVPGFIDIHVHGGAGRYVMEGTHDAQDAIAAHLACHGVTAFLPTTITGPWEQQVDAARVAHDAVLNPPQEKRGATVLGCHLEGPYINPKKKGAQPEQFIRPPDEEELRRELRDAIASVKIVTLAPEMEGALPLIRSLAHQGIVASIGHTDATYAQMSAAVDAGARHVTHCFNAMRQMEGREPGVVGAAFQRPELTAELIWDNVHVHPVSCRALVQAKGAQGVILISDGIPGAGMEEGYAFSLGDLPVTIQNGSARLPDGTLAGSVLTLDRAFSNAGAFTLRERAAMTSRNAAVALGLGDIRGLLAPGYIADLTLLNRDGSVYAVFAAGEQVYPVV